MRPFPGAVRDLYEDYVHNATDFVTVSKYLSEMESVLDPALYVSREVSLPYESVNVASASIVHDILVEESEDLCITCGKMLLQEDQFALPVTLRMRTRTLYRMLREVDPAYDTWRFRFRPDTCDVATERIPAVIECDNHWTWRDFEQPDLKATDSLWFVCAHERFASELRRFYLAGETHDMALACTVFLGSLHTLLPLTDDGGTLLVGISKKEQSRFVRYKVNPTKTPGFDSRFRDSEIILIGMGRPQDRVPEITAYRVAQLIQDLVIFIGNLKRYGYPLLADFVAALHVVELSRVTNDNWKRWKELDCRDIEPTCAHCAKAKSRYLYRVRNQTILGVLHTTESKALFLIRRLTDYTESFWTNMHDWTDASWEYVMRATGRMMKMLEGERKSLYEHLVWQLSPVEHLQCRDCADPKESRCWLHGAFSSQELPPRWQNALWAYEWEANMPDVEAARYVVGMPEYITHIGFSDYRMGNSCQGCDQAHVPVVRRLNHYNVAECTRFIANMVEAGIPCTPSILIQHAMEIEWKYLNLAYWAEIHESGDEHAEKSMCIALMDCMVNILGPEFSFTPNNHMHLDEMYAATPPEVALFGRLLMYRAEVQNPIPPRAFWSRVANMVGRASERKVHGQGVMGNVVGRLLQERRGGCHMLECQYAARDSPPAQKVAFVYDFLQTMAICRCQFSQIGGILQWCRQIGFRFVNHVDDETRIVSGATGVGTAVHALSLFWDLVMDPDVGLFERHGSTQYRPTERMIMHNDSANLMYGLIIAILASTCNRVYCKLNLHPYLFIMDDTLLKPDIAPFIDERERPLYTLLVAGTESTRDLVSMHLDILFDTSPTAFRAVVSSYPEYVDHMMGQIASEMEKILPARIWSPWIRGFIAPATIYLQQMDSSLTSLATHRLLYILGAGGCLGNTSTMTYEGVRDKILVHSDAPWMKVAFDVAMENMKPEQLRKFLIFTTSKADLYDGDGVTVKIFRHTTKKPIPYPNATTCISTLHIYVSPDWNADVAAREIEKMLTVSLEHTEYFGLS